MFKRMSMLQRLPADSREVFARKWQHHGTLVAQLPLIRTYVQNHVVEEFGTGMRSFVADGIVELRFDKPADMTAAFTSPPSVAVKADEPGFLGHGTGYALANDSLPLESQEGCKLIAVFQQDSGDAAADILNIAHACGGFLQAARDEVADVIARPEMKQGPQLAGSFLHLLFSTQQFAADAALALLQRYDRQAIFRVRTLKVR